MTTKVFLSEARAQLQRFGGFISGMVMPIIGIFIAWGLLTAFFIPTGWIPNVDLNNLVGIGINYLIPILIGFMGGQKIYQLRGGVMGALVTISAIAAGQSSIFVSITGGQAPMLLGAMIYGPLSAAILKHSEKFWIHKIKPGFEMLINNFYLGILGFLLAVFGFFVAAYVIGYIIFALGQIVQGMSNYSLYPLAAIIVEPAKVLFLNNAINHGVFTPLATQEVLTSGKSILYLLESNPGPGLGILLLYIIFGNNKKIKGEAGSASIIHFFGGIHEVYFPFVLVKPMLIIALISAGVFGNGMFMLFNAGAIAPVSPGSVIAQYTQVAKDANSVAGLTIGMFGSAVISFGVGLVIFWFEKIIRKIRKQPLKEQISISEAKQKVADMKAKGKVETKPLITSFNIKEVKTLTIACDAGMGSSVMGTGILKKLLATNGLNDIKVEHKSIADVTGKEEYIITVDALKDRVLKKTDAEKVTSINNLINKNAYQEIIDRIKSDEDATKSKFKNIDLVVNKIDSESEKLGAILQGILLANNLKNINVQLILIEQIINNDNLIITSEDLKDQVSEKIKTDDFEIIKNLSDTESLLKIVEKVKA
ncbi:PTS transporter subunit EIIC [Mycoplasmopsis agassizii]|uniref:Uncharacterized protein n=1 Tax=Mycoplasmopsis agassizii TaxID=33922 RepID=A0ABX4H4B7_9BACT|nr:PTS transporter subunit EIIC [Mycoplasmopsis agassizii]PAF54713.1 hypothetical protein CJF60_03160 [Mycoplasmopsis agassizii]SMC15958.1 PTS system, mannitol-specific IIC component [Mycoplasmopsis agassizii]